MRSVFTATIANGASVSDAWDMGLGGGLIGLISPSAWTAAGIQLEGSMDNVTFYPLTDTLGSAVGISSVTVSLMYYFDALAAMPARYIRVRSGTSAVPVNQGAARTLYLIARQFN